MKPLRATDPSTVGEFTVLGRLGSGGMGEVYLAATRSGRPVAVKVIRPEIAADPMFRARFVREVAAARQVGGFWTASVVAADADAEAPWLATEYVPGPSLRYAVAEAGPLPAATMRVMGARLAEALSAIHAVGLVHRDLKPANVLLAPDGPMVIDFGIARAFLTDTAGATAVIGTPSYMSPEQIRGEPLTPASDVFSLGSTLVYALRGHGAFNTGAPEGVIFRVVSEPPDLRGVPAELAGLVAACLAKDPAARPTTGALLSELGPAVGAVVTPYGDWRPPPYDPVAAFAESARLSTTGTQGPGEPPPDPPGQPPAPSAPFAPSAPPGPPGPPGPESAQRPRPPAVPALVTPTMANPAVYRGGRHTVPASPSERVAKYLSPTERYRAEWARHNVHLGTPVGIGVAATLLLGLLVGFTAAYLDVGWFTTLLLLIWVVVMLWAIWQVAERRRDRLVLTDQRVMVTTGLIAQQVVSIPLVKITNVRFDRPWLGRILDYGTLTVVSAGATPARLEVPRLPAPSEVYLQVAEEHAAAAQA